MDTVGIWSLLPPVVAIVLALFTREIVLSLVAAILTGAVVHVLVLAATLAGSVMGDHCSPIADTTILSSTGAQCKHINHVMTQIPYASCAGFLCLILYLIIGFLV